MIVRRGENVNVAIFSDTVNIINVKLCMMVVLSYLYPFIPLSVTLIVISRSQQCQTVLNEKLMFLSDKVETLYAC